jgi:hypothetical protein
LALLQKNPNRVASTSRIVVVAGNRSITRRQTAGSQSANKVPLEGSAESEAQCPLSNGKRLDRYTDFNAAVVQIIPMQVSCVPALRSCVDAVSRSRCIVIKTPARWRRAKPRRP